MVGASRRCTARLAVDWVGMLDASWEQVLHDSAQTRVVRVSVAAGAKTVVYKEAKGPAATERLRHESEVLRRLVGVQGVSRLVDGPGRGTRLVLEDVRGSPVTGGNGQPLEGIELVDFALAVARVVAAVHHNGLLHKDISPANILVDEHHRPTLIDFDLASAVPDEAPVHDGPAPGEITGTLAYVAPEQTGRTGRRIDQRSDLYALGATLYEVATGSPPFGNGDPFRLVYDHLARIPIPPVECAAGVPMAFSDIVMRLLEKEPDSRYQTAEGLIYDLQLLREREAAGNRRPFVLGEHDFPLRLPPPSQLVGRKPELDVLSTAFREAAHGPAQGVLIVGESGVGKSALLNELRRSQPFSTT